MTEQERGRGTWATALALALLIGVFPQFALGALGPQLRNDLGLSPADLGLAFTALYVLGVAGSPIAGPLADRIGGRITCFGLLLVSGTSLWAASVVSTRLGLLAAMVPAGAAMALANPGTTRWAAAAGTARRQASLVGIAQAGVQAGALVAGGLASAAALGLDWRGALRIGSLIAAIGAVATWYGPKDRATTPAPPARDGDTGTQTSPEVHRAQRSLAGYALLMGGGTAIVFAYLPSYGVDVVGLSIPTAGATTMVFGATALICRLLLGVILRRGDQVGPRLLSIMSIGAAGSIGLLAAGAASSVWLWSGVVLFGATGTTWPVAAYLAVLRHSPKGSAGRVTGWVTASFYLGLWMTPGIAGHVIAEFGYPLVWLGAIVLYLASLTAAWSLPRRRATSAG
jgi:predicted MFS family arabinose efflux permease